MKSKSLKRLIVNADDFGLVSSVSEGILEANGRGIVTSTTAFANHPIAKTFLKRAKSSKTLGVGIHLSLTKGEPVLVRSKVPSLVGARGEFERLSSERVRSAQVSQLKAEWKAQIERFRKTWGRLPTHLDSHHHVHAVPKFWPVFLGLALEYRLPFRLPQARFPKTLRNRFLGCGVELAEGFLGDLDARNHWTTEKLLAALVRVPGGTTELMCHPGYVSPSLSRVSAFREGREAELRALASPKVWTAIGRLGIALINFDALRS